MSRHRRSKKDKLKIIRAVGIVLAALVLCGAGLKVIDLWENRQSAPIPSAGESNQSESAVVAESSVVYGDEEYVFNKDVETFLVLGLDGNGDSVGTKQADFVLLFVIDNANKTYTPIQISRDTMVDMKVLDITGTKVIDRVKQQIALAHSYGNGKERSCRNVAESVSSLLLGMPIGHYLSVTMDAVAVYNDYLGGVEVEVLEDFTGVDDSLVKGETVTLMGNSALMYVRARQGLDDPSNENRMARQRQYLNALYEKSRAAAAENDGFEAEALSKIIGYTVSDCSLNKLQTLFEKVSAYEMKDIISLKGESRKGEQYMEFYPDEEFLEKTVIELFYLPQ